jgi:folate-binding protein YgfZ
MAADDNGAMIPSLPIDGGVTLTHWGVMRAQGADAAKFLHGQLTSDISLLGLSQARLAGFCSAKGRLQASFVVWKIAHDELLLACAASVLPATLKRMSMFVLRAQCKLRDASAELRLIGLAGASATARLGDAAVWERRDAVEGGTLIRLPDAAGLQRAWWVLPIDAQASTAGLPAIALDAWRWLEVRSGVPLIEAATVDQFVPQMLNLELLGGVDFQKGCYPGQEVVARSQYRGTLKRRMFLFELESAATAGQEVFAANDPGQPAGMIVNAARHPGGGPHGSLVAIKLDALDSPGLKVGAPDGPTLQRAALPYAVPNANGAD